VTKGVHLAAYRDAGFDVRAIASRRSRANAARAAQRWQIPRVHDDPAALPRDPGIAVVGKVLSVNQNMRYDQSMRVLQQRKGPLQM